MAIAILSNARAIRTALMLSFALACVWFYVKGCRPDDGTIHTSLYDPTQTSSLHLANSQGLSSSENIAAIIETRMLDNLIPLILHFASVLGPSWKVVLFTLEDVWQMPPSVAFRQAVEDGQVKVQFLPTGTDLTKWTRISHFMTRPWLWEQLQAAPRVLLFQADSIICANSAKTVDDFLEWDFIGAPVSPMLGVGFNGGLSLRNPRMILDILASSSDEWDELYEKKDIAFVEDQFYYKKMLELPHARLPDIDTAKEFSVETVWYERPFGFHAAPSWNAERMDEIRKYCPEVDLANKERKELFADVISEG